MKRILTTIFLVIMILTVAGVVFMPHQANASWWCLLGGPATCLAQGIAGSMMDSFFSELANLVLRVVSWFLILIGILLNASIILTMNIKAIYEATPAIDELWIIVRNFSSIFIIFTLLYTSIRTILGSGTSGIKSLIGNIIMAGLLINFSLFFTKVAIDTSNLVSLQFYRAIVPNSMSAIGKGEIGTVILSSFKEGGLSDVFMSNLKVDKIYNKREGIFDTNGGEYFKVLVSTLAGSGLMIVAGLSFLAASAMFTIRLVVLLLLMGFSPVYFAGMIFPAVKSKMSDKWLDYLTQALIFMPVYLFFMYIALRFISTMNPGEGFFAQLDDVGKTGDKSNDVMLPIVGLLLQYTIAFILINIPLIAAMQLGGKSAAWGNNAKKWVGSYVGRNSVGRWASKADKALEKTKFGTDMLGKSVRSLTTTKLANSKMGGWTSRKDDEKEEKDTKQKHRAIDNLNNLRIAVKAGNHPEIKKLLGNMSSSEITALDKDVLTHANMAQHLTSSQYAAIDKSEKSDSDKTTIRAARVKAITEVVRTADKNGIKNVMKSMSGEDLQAYLESLPPGQPISTVLIEQIRPSQLKDMDGMNDSIRHEIGGIIRDWNRFGMGTGNHPATKFVTRDNKDIWLP